MKKTLTISALVAVLSLPAFAEIANNATCNNTNLGQSDNNSTANVEANWNANTININWYNGDTRVAQNTCTYDGQITLPAQPSKPGYTFAGWKLKTNNTVERTEIDACYMLDNEQECNEYYTYVYCQEPYNFDCLWDNEYSECYSEKDKGMCS